jgi:O-antigen/teichoic acid export membrane protein
MNQRTELPGQYEMLLRHSAFYFLARGLSGIINFLAIVLYTRLLLPEEYGQYALVIAWVGFAQAIFFQWLQLGLLRFFPAHLDNSQSLLSSVRLCFLWLMVVTGVLGALALVFFWSCPLWRALVGLSVLLLWAQARFELDLELIRSQLKPITYGLAALLKSVLTVGVGVALVYGGLGAHGALLGLLVGTAISSAGLGWHQWREVRLSLAESHLLRNLLSYGLPLGATLVLTCVIHSSDRFLLGWIIGADATGLYAAGYNLTQQSLGLLMAMVNLAAYPLVVRSLEGKGLETAQRYLRQYNVTLLAIAIPAATGLAVLAPNIASVMLGGAFVETAIALIPPIALAILISGVKSFYLDLGFQLGYSTLGLIWVGIGAAVVNVSLNLWLIPILGPIGAAYATVAGYSVGLILSFFLGRRVFRLPPWSVDSLKVFSAAMCMAAVLWPIRLAQGEWVLAGQVALGGLVYGSLLVVLNVGRARDNFFRFLMPLWHR